MFHTMTELCNERHCWTFNESEGTECFRDLAFITRRPNVHTRLAKNIIVRTNNARKQNTFQQIGFGILYFFPPHYFQEMLYCDNKPNSVFNFTTENNCVSYYYLTIELICLINNYHFVCKSETVFTYSCELTVNQAHLCYEDFGSPPELGLIIFTLFLINNVLSEWEFLHKVIFGSVIVPMRYCNIHKKKKKLLLSKPNVLEKTVFYFYFSKI